MQIVPASIARAIDLAVADFMLKDVLYEISIACCVVLGGRFLKAKKPHLLSSLRIQAVSFSKRQYRAIMAAACLPLVIRLALLPALPMSGPFLHDDFVHLLVADTVAHGRLANPPHPESRFFESIYVIQHPSYAAKYPIGPGAFLALGKVVAGDFWWGLWLSVGLMTAALCWMLYAFLPPQWALIGGCLGGALFGGATPWMYTYSGGAVPAAGGALLLGSLARLRLAPRPALFAAGAIGWSIVWFSRPYESLTLAALTMIAAFLHLRRRPSLMRHSGLLKGLAAIGLVVGAAGGLTLLHNYRVTGHSLIVPYIWSQREYGVPQGLIVQRVVPEPGGLNRQQHDIYVRQREQRLKAATPAGFPKRLGVQIYKIWMMFIGYALTLPFLVGLVLWKGKSRNLALGFCAAGFATSSIYPSFFNHYFAPYACLMLLVSVEGLRILCLWKPAGRPAGRALAAGILVCVFLTMFRYAAPPQDLHRELRADVLERLTAISGKHLVFVEYGLRHGAHAEWVYNTADIDSAPVVWARSLGPEQDRELIQYYGNRRVWSLAPDDETKLERYAPQGGDFH